MLLGFCGVALLYLGGDDNSTSQLQPDFSMLPALLALMAAIFLGFYGAYSSTIKTNSHLRFMVLSCISGCIVLLPWLIFKVDSIYSVTWPLFFTAVLYGIAVEAFGTFFWTRANILVRESNVNITKITSLMLFLPFISAMFLFLIYGEKDFLQTQFLTGLLLLAIGTALCNRASPNSQNN